MEMKEDVYYSIFYRKAINYYEKNIYLKIFNVV